MVKNLEAAKELVQLYRSITKEQLIEVYNDILKENQNLLEESNYEVDYEEVLSRITGFGKMSTCHLCKAICGGMCVYCIHYQFYPDSLICPCIRHDTYRDIVDSNSIDTLYEAIQKRADYLEELIQELNYDN